MRDFSVAESGVAGVACDWLLPWLEFRSAHAATDRMSAEEKINVPMGCFILTPKGEVE